MRIGCFGAARMVTGSCFVVETSGAKILVDCGFFQGQKRCGTRNYDDFGFDVKEIDAIVITHGHLDHIGRLPRFFEQGGKAPIFSTKATRDLAEILLDDAHGIMLEESEECGQQPLYSEEDLEECLGSWRGMSYRQPKEVAPGVTVTWHDAGHILGSSFVVIEADGKRIAFTGDVGSTSVPLLADTEALPKRLDLIMCESTYGDRLHERVGERKEMLRAVAEENYRNGGVLIVPAFSIERTQEILYELNLLVENEGARIGQVFLDSPLAIEAIAVFNKHHKEFLDVDVPEGFTDDNFFRFPGLKVTSTVPESKGINRAENPKIIIAGAGMMNAGRIQHHLIRYLSDPNNTLLITGYQAEGTLGRKIQEGESPVQIMRYSIDVRAKVIKIGSYSGHADYNKLVNWVSEAAPQRVRLIHGDPEAQDAMIGHLKHKGVTDVAAPEFGEWIEV